eukprot:746229-Hanusia_phi.AAC.3
MTWEYGGEERKLGYRASLDDLVLVPVRRSFPRHSDGATCLLRLIVVGLADLEEFAVVLSDLGDINI